MRILGCHTAYQTQLFQKTEISVCRVMKYFTNEACVVTVLMCKNEQPIETLGNASEVLPVHFCLPFMTSGRTGEHSSVQAKISPV